MSHIKILIIEDKVSENTDTVNILNSLGFEVSTLTSNFEELCAQDINHDLVVVELASTKNYDELKLIFNELNTPVIFITESSEEFEIDQLNLKQLHDQLERPFTPTELKYSVEFLVYKHETEKKLTDVANNTHLLFKNSPIPYHSLDPEGNILDVNTAFLNVLGYSKEEVTGKNITEFMTSNTVEHFEKNFTEFQCAGEIHKAEVQLKRNGGSHIIVSYDAKIGYDESNSVKQTHCFLQDMTEVRMYEEKIKEINHLHSTISQINQSILRIKDKDKLFQTVCDVFIEYGNFEMAWVGLLDYETGDIKPVAYAGNESGYLKKIPLNLYKDPILQELWLKKFKNGSLGVMGNVDSFKNREWREEAINRGYYSLISLPLKVEGKIIGVINIYSSKPNYYLEEEIDLISKIGLDISFAIKVIDTENERRLAEIALKDSEKQYRDLVDNSLIGIYKTNVKGEILFANQSVANLFNYDSVEELKNHNIIDVYKNKDDRREFLEVLNKKGRISRCERENIRKDGQTVHVLSSASLDGDVISGMFMDITDRKQVEDRFHSIINNSADLFIIVNSERRITFSYPTSERILGYSNEFLTGKDPSDFIHHEDVGIFKEHLEEVSKTRNKVLFSEYRIRKSNGEYLPVESVSQNMKNVDGINGIVLTAHPIQERKEMEETLQKSEERYKTLFQLDPDYTLVLGLDGKILDVNSATEQFSGISKEKLVGKRFNDLNICPTQDESMHMAKFSKLLEDGKLAPYESRVIDLEGEIHWVKTVLTIIKRNNVPIYYLIIATDITELKKKEEALKENQRVFETLISNLPGVAYRCKNDSRWTMEFVSGGCYSLTGYHAEDLIENKEVSYNEIIHPDDRERVWDTIQKALDKNEQFKMIYRICTKDRSTKYVWEQGMGIFSDKNELMWLEGFITDVTRRIIDEEKIKESEIYYRTMFENTGTATVIIEKDKTISELNTEAANLSGYAKDEIENKKKWTDFVAKTDLNRLKNYFEMRMKSESAPKKYETKLINKAGNVKDIFVTIARIPGTEKELASILDITELKNAEKDLQASLKEKDILLKEIHHRVKNNMQIVSSLLSLQTQYVDEDETQNVLRESQGRVKTMAMIHEKLYSSNDFTQIRFDEYIVKLVSDIFYSCNINKDRIKPVVHVDEVNLNIETAIPCGLIINELISNSLKYAFPNGATGTICLCLKKSRENYVLTISDSGVGFPESLDFRNTDSLGLQLVNNLVDQIDGKIELNTDQGTKFSIEFKEQDYKERIAFRG
ncbi:signal transduction histidine kinase [Methanobacterium lacus]|uniref:Signal transduction histidine kinase n=1 Tax=Methanobacterium lacus (strain AL-21) TaxID=877455 RepID=F0T9U9_METLA|nr:PAS domain S-box protein [Methanobacterium lacus]ADZ09978.1 signal transduction histidine kinase [Methanobacterium lacus]